MNVFISHNSADKPFVRRLAASLRSFGITSWIDEAELNFGDSLIQSISSAIQSIDVVLAVISSHSVSSAWVSKELSLAMTKEITLSQVVVIPIIIDKCDIPFYLRDKLYADFTQAANYDVQLERLVRAIDHHSGIKRRPIPPRKQDVLGTPSKLKYRPTNSAFALQFLLLFAFSVLYLVLDSFASQVSPQGRQWSQYVLARSFMLMGIGLTILGFISIVLLRVAMKVDPNLAADVGNLAISGLLVRRFRRIVPRYWRNNVFKVYLLVEVAEYAIALGMVVIALKILL